MFTITKCYRDLPAAHRQPNHDGHCRFVHGHDWGFDITVSADRFDENGFVIDVGKMKEVKKYLEHMFDHTLLINEADPFREQFELMHEDGLADVRIVLNCGMECLAELVCDQVQALLNHTVTDGRTITVTSVTCHEDSKNSATYKA